ncbi:hypothetical protein [Halorussus pelagicus]|uniref:hypothetical protein n=1 Tax=Halorussus pelagicus TaxID=2505977 RepID=UPI000FFC78C4|nr:hypothetical protein [Halorussus pelagicus]
MATDARREEPLAEVISGILYEIAGWLSILLGLAAAVSVVAHAFSSRAAVGPLAVLTVFSALFLALGVSVHPGLRDRIERRHGIGRFGRATTVDQRVVRPHETHPEQCVRCGAGVERGVVRRYREEYVLAGVPVLTASAGRNSYCAECALDELSTPETEDLGDDESSSRGEQSVSDDREISKPSRETTR